MRKLLLITLCFSFVFTSCKKEKSTQKEMKTEAKDNLDSENKQKKELSNFFAQKISPISDKQKSIYSYNLQVSEKRLEKKINNSKKLIPESCFTENLDSIKLKISIPNNQFKFINAMNLIEKPKGGKKGILIHITDNTNNESCDKNITHILEVNISIKDVLPYYATKEKLKLEKGDKLFVMVVNDTPKDFKTNIKNTLKGIEKHIKSVNNLNTCFKLKEIIPDIANLILEPKQGGGGVVVRWP